MNQIHRELFNEAMSNLNSAIAMHRMLVTGELDTESGKSQAKAAIGEALALIRVKLMAIHTPSADCLNDEDKRMIRHRRQIRRMLIEYDKPNVTITTKKTEIKGQLLSHNIAKELSILDQTIEVQQERHVATIHLCEILAIKPPKRTLDNPSNKD